MDEDFCLESHNQSVDQRGVNSQMFGFFLHQAIQIIVVVINVSVSRLWGRL